MADLQQGNTLMTMVMTCTLFAQRGCRYGRFEAVGEQIVAFLRDLFGERVLKSNLIIVVTSVINSNRAMKERKANNQTLESIIDGVRMKVQKAFGLQHSLTAIDIDTMPVSSKKPLYTRINPLVLNLSLEARGLGGLVISAGWLTADCPKYSCMDS